MIWTEGVKLCNFNKRGFIKRNAKKEGWATIKSGTDLSGGMGFVHPIVGRGVKNVLLSREGRKEVLMVPYTKRTLFRKGI